MATVTENRAVWQDEYAWPEGGDEWSAAWGGTPNLWHGTLMPRIGRYLPCDAILEIAPGFGRFTQYLVRQCRELTVVDLSEKCIDACKRRFKSASNIRYHVNDGLSLEMIPDGSVDFLFCFDSLVHAEEEVIANYLMQLGRKLKVCGVGFIHHSNWAQVDSPGLVNLHWRSPSMSASNFRSFCRDAGVQCTVQEIVNWGGPHLSDCLSLFTRAADRQQEDTRVFENNRFMDEAENLRLIQSRYSAQP